MDEGEDKEIRTDLLYFQVRVCGSYCQNKETPDLHVMGLRAPNGLYNYMSVRELWQDFKKLEERLVKLEQGTHSIDSIDKVLEEIDKLKNQYKMMNARISRKNNGKEDG
jgi:hypothetical protein